VYTYAVYPVILKLIDIFVPRPEFKKTGDLPPVSLIIAAHNEEKVIRGRIENCLSLDYPRDRLEVIIASDGSDDGTNDIVRSYAGGGIRLLDYSRRRGKVNALNDAVKECRHSILVFSDANTMFKRDAVKNLVRHFGDPRVGCVCGGLQFININDGKTGALEGVYWRYETTLKKLAGRRGYLLGANGGIFALRKELYQPCPSNTIVEDFVIAMRVLQQGFRVIYDPFASALEETSQRFIQEKKRRVRIGAGDYQAITLLWPMLNPFRGFSAFAFWSHKVVRWMAPFLMIAAFVTNLLLLASPLYRSIFVLQSLFYGGAFAGQILSRTRYNVKFLGLCYYFVSMNYALLLGFFQFIRGIKTAAWERTERQDGPGASDG
jgi:cellulose synthase/poly-beta-1,6-N-acetylglucosamine synthase-like glycosyltransferase